MPSPPNVEHPNNQLSNVKKSPFANYQNTPTRGGKCGLTVCVCPYFSQNAHFLLASRKSSRTYRNLPILLQEEHGFSPNKKSGVKARSNILGNGSAATVANAGPQPSEQANSNWGATLGKMDANYCSGASP